MNDRLSDMLTRIKNAYAARKDSISLRTTKFCLVSAKILESAGFVQSVKEEKGELVILLKYAKGVPAVFGIRRLSKPSRHLYVSARRLAAFDKDIGMVVVSTSKGVLPHRDAIKQNLGGELLYKVW